MHSLKLNDRLYLNKIDQTYHNGHFLCSYICYTFPRYWKPLGQPGIRINMDGLSRFGASPVKLGRTIYLGILLEVIIKKIKFFIKKNKIKFFYYFFRSVTTMTTVGYGDISANTKYEAMYLIIALLFACMFFSYTFGIIGMLLT
jgi:hypothetical protein